MTVAVNLLPRAYRQARRRRCRLRIGLVIGSTLIAVELVVALVLHFRAETSRRLIQAATSAQSAADAVQQKLVGPAQQANQIQTQLRLAKALRARHEWSRLLAALAGATPDNVLFTTLATQPPRWTPDLAASVTFKATDLATGEDVRTGKPPVQGVTLQGFALDYQDLSRLVSAVHGTGAFAAVNLKKAQRDQFQEQEAIAFELECRW